MALAAADQLQMKKENNSELSVSNDHREWVVNKNTTKNLKDVPMGFCGQGTTPMVIIS